MIKGFFHVGIVHKIVYTCIGGIALNFTLEYIGILRISQNELNVFFTMYDSDFIECPLSVTLEYHISTNIWSLSLLSHEFEEECPVCGNIAEQCVLDDVRRELLLDYLLDFLAEQVPAFTYELQKELH